MSEEAMLLRELKQAQQNFKEADQEHVNIAIYNLMCAEEKLKQFREGRKADEGSLKECDKECDK